jgi:hypothetical protein
LLAQCQPEKLDLPGRSDIQAQRLRENDAHARYQDLRARSLEAAQIGYEKSN